MRQKRFHSAPINIFVEPDDKEFLKQFCEKQNKSISMYLRDHIKKLRYSGETV